jgi:hypothetical protein
MPYPPTTQTAVEADAGGLLPPGDGDPPQEVIVLFTTHSGTLAALQTASRLGAKLGAPPQVVMLYEVPYTLPLEERAIPEGFRENEVRALKRDFHGEVLLRICLCRHPRQILRQVLPPRALIVMGAKKRWWPSREGRLARMLRKEGYELVIAKSK